MERPRRSRTERTRPLGVELPEGDIRRGLGCRLHNLGNTCYQSVILQLLYNCPDLRAHVLSFTTAHQACEEALCFPRDLAQHMAEVAQAAAHASTLSARWVLPHQERAAFVVGDMYRQSDPADFLHAVVDWCFDQAPEGHRLEGIKAALEGEAYEREWTDVAAFPQCKAARRKLMAQPFITLNVPVPPLADTREGITLEACIETSMFEEKVVSGRECEDCPHGRHAKHQQLRLSRLPAYVTFRLLRFDNSLRKVRTPVIFPERLDLAAHADVGEGGSAFSLVAVVVHQGRTRQRGHYFVYVRVAEGVWWLFDDDHKHMQVDEAKVFQQTEPAYMLVYRKDDGSQALSEDAKVEGAKGEVEGRATGEKGEGENELASKRQRAGDGADGVRK